MTVSQCSLVIKKSHTHTPTHTHTNCAPLPSFLHLSLSPATSNLNTWNSECTLSVQSVLQYCNLDGADEGHLSHPCLLFLCLFSSSPSFTSPPLPPLLFLCPLPPFVSVCDWTLKPLTMRLCDQSGIVDNESPVTVTAAPSIRTQTDTRHYRREWEVYMSTRVWVPGSMSLQLYPLNECSLILGMIGAIRSDGGGVCVMSTVDR